MNGSDELLSTILARVFWTRWTLRRLETEVPNKIELEYSRREETRLTAIDLQYPQRVQSGCGARRVDGKRQICILMKRVGQVRDDCQGLHRES